MLSLTGNFSSGAVERFAPGGTIHHVNIYINSGKTFTDRCLKNLLRHEIGHALGLPHHSNPIAVMFESISIPSCRYTLALEDIDQFSTYDPCFAEIDDDLNISIPVININGLSYSAYFQLSGVTWSLLTLREQEFHNCNESRFIDDLLTIDRASSPLGWMKLRVLHEAGIWRLIDYQLL